MTDSRFPTRKMIRLKGYDYSQFGSYFVTICLHDKTLKMGSIIQDRLIPNHFGKMIEDYWKKISLKFQNATCEYFTLMPDHIHGIIQLSGLKSGRHMGRPLPDIIKWFKSMTTNAYIRNVDMKNWPRFNKRIWQRNYYEHIIRGEKDLEYIFEYIENNPLKWAIDKNKSKKS